MEWIGVEEAPAAAPSPPKAHAEGGPSQTPPPNPAPKPLETSQTHPQTPHKPPPKAPPNPPKPFPSQPDYVAAEAEFPGFRKKFGPRGVLHTFADGRIEDTGPLNKKRMEARGAPLLGLLGGWGV
jgi:hypothetical protein